MADEKKQQPRRGCFAKLMTLVLMLGVAGLAVAIYFFALPEDLSDVAGDEPGQEPPPPRELAVVLKNSIDRGFAVTLSEEEINSWLARTLETRQGGLLEDHVSLEGVWVRLKKDHAEVIMERRIYGQLHTVSMFLRIEQTETEKGITKELFLDGGLFHENLPFPRRGGRFGRLTVPQGFLILVRSSYAELAALFDEEIALGLEEMARIRINEGSVTFDPRAPSLEMPLPDSY